MPQRDKRGFGTLEPGRGRGVALVLLATLGLILCAVGSVDGKKKIDIHPRNGNAYVEAHTAKDLANYKKSLKAAEDLRRESKKVLKYSFAINRVFKLNQCLTDDDILRVLSEEELRRVRENTKQILDGSFLDRAVGNLGLGYYKTSKDHNDVSLNESRPFPKALIVETNAWDSNNVACTLAAMLLQDVLNYPTYLWEILFVGPLGPYDRAAAGWTHLNFENWPSDNTQLYEYYVYQTQQVQDMGVQNYPARNGVYFPSYMLKWERNKNYILTAYQSLRLPEVNSQFRKFNPKNYRQKKRLEEISGFSCINTFCKDGFFIPKVCRKDPTECYEYLAADADFAVAITEQMFNNLDIPFVIVYMGGSYMWEFVAERIFNKEAVLFFSWDPTPFNKRFDVTRVQFPEPTAECYDNRKFTPDGSIDCDYQFDMLNTIAWHELNEFAPSAIEFANRYHVSGSAMADMMRRFARHEPKWFDGDDNQYTVWNATCSWLRENGDTWRLWIPVPVKSVRKDFDTWAVALIIALGSLGMALAIFIAILVFVFRKRTIIKFSEPMFLYIMLAGAFLACLGTIFNVIPTPLETYSCQIIIWLVNIGFTLFFGSLLTKTFRLVYIFFSLQKLQSSNPPFDIRHLLLVVTLLLGLDVIILGTWSGVDLLSATEVPDDNDSTSYWILCRSDNDTIYIIVLAVYKCILVGAAIIMGFLARRLPNVLNESYSITLTVYNIGFFTAIILPVTAVLHNDPDAAMIVRCLGIIFCAIASMVLIFVPKFWVIHKKKHGASEIDGIMEGIHHEGASSKSRQGTTGNSISGH